MFMIEQMRGREHGKRSSLRWLFERHYLAPRSNELQKVVQVVFFKMFFENNKYELSVNVHVFHHPLDHGLALDVDKGLWKGKPRLQKLFPRACHGNNDAKLASLPLWHGFCSFAFAMCRFDRLCYFLIGNVRRVCYSKNMGS